MVRFVVLRLAILVILVCGILLAFRAEADDYMSFMAGVFSSAAGSPAEVKFLNLGHRDELGFGHLLYQYEVGGWVDIAGGGRLSSGYVATQVGCEAGDSVVGRVMVGPALISTPDTYLGGVFQITTDFYLGIKGSNRNMIGIKYKHMSSAGIEQPNMGRDFLGLEASIPF